MIYGCDSHYIYEEDAQERTDFLYSKEIEYPDEEGWYLDYPDGDTVYKRFVEQGVLSHDEIMEALGNTNVFLQVEDYHSDIFNQEIKLPTLYPNLTQEQKTKNIKVLSGNAGKITKSRFRFICTLHTKRKSNEKSTS